MQLSSQASGGQSWGHQIRERGACQNVQCLMQAVSSGCMALWSPVGGLGSCGSMLLKVCGKALVEPQLPPVVHGDQVTKPLQHNRPGVPLQSWQKVGGTKKPGVGRDRQELR